MTKPDASQPQSPVLLIPGVVGTSGPTPSKRHVIHVGPSAGWMPHEGIMTWQREVSVVHRSDLPEPLLEELRIRLPQDLILAFKYPWSHKAAKTSPLVAVSTLIADQLVAKGIRVHTVGFDKISGGFFYIAIGGDVPEVRIQGDLYESIIPSLGETNTNLDVEACLDGLIDRLLREYSNDLLSEIAVELADAIPRVAPLGTEVTGIDGFEKGLAAREAASAALDPQGRAIVNALGKSLMRGEKLVLVPLLGGAERDTQPALQLDLREGKDGQVRRVSLPAKDRWIVSRAASQAALGRASAEAPAVEKKTAVARVQLTKQAVEVQPSADKAPAASDLASNKVVTATVEPAKTVEAKPLPTKPAVEPTPAAPKVEARRIAEKPAQEKPMEQTPAPSKVVARRPTPEAPPVAEKPEDPQAIEPVAAPKQAEPEVRKSAEPEVRKSAEPEVRKSAEPQARESSDVVRRDSGSVRPSEKPKTVSKPPAEQSLQKAATKSVRPKARRKSDTVWFIVFIILVILAAVISYHVGRR